MCGMRINYRLKKAMAFGNIIPIFNYSPIVQEIVRFRRIADFEGEPRSKLYLPLQARITTAMMSMF